MGDTKGLTKAFNDASQSSNKLGSAFSAIGKAAAVGLGALGVGAVVAGKHMIGMASDAAEVQSKLEVVFGKTLPGLTAEIDKFSAATGTSKFAMREQAADMGALLAPMLGSKQGAADMSLQFVKLATDLGSFNNIPTGEALEKIRAGLVGEAEPLRSLGVLLTEATTKEYAYTHGIAKRGAELTEVQKVESRAGQIMQQTALAQGDATRTADSFANQLKKLKSSVSDTATELGTALLPMASKVLGALNEGAAGVTNFLSKLSAAKGFEAKIKVVFEGLQELGKKALVIGMDVGKQLTDALGKVNWSEAGNTIAKSIGGALKKAIPAAMDMASAFTSGLLTAVSAIDWVVVGREIGIGLKDGIKKGAVSWVKGGMMDMLKAGANPGLILQNAIGKDVGNALAGQVSVGTVGGMKVLPGTIINALNTATAASSGTARTRGGELGTNLALGMASGIAANASAAATQAAVMVNEAYWSAATVAHIRSPSKLFATLGEATVEGYILGITTKMPELKGKMAEAIRAALDAARDVVAKYQDVFADAFGKLGEYAKRAFDAKTQNILDNVSKKFDAQIAKWQNYAQAMTPAEKALAALDAAEQKRSQSSAVAAAEESLAKAQAMAEGAERDAAILAAQEAMRQAQLAIQRAGLEAQAAAERVAAETEAAAHIAKLEATKARELQNLEERRRQLAEKLDEQLTTLQTRLSKHPEEYDKIQKKIEALLKSYGVPMNKAGENLGKAFAAGLRAAENEVVAAARALAKAVERQLKLGSPAKEGPLSHLDTWFKPMGPMLAKQMNGSALAGAASRMASGAAMGGPSMAMAGAGGGYSGRGGGGWPERIVLQVDGRTLAEVVRKEVGRTIARNK